MNARNKRLQRNIAKAYLFRFLQYFHLIAGVLVPFFTDWGHIPFHKVMILQACFMIFTFALEVPTGAVADKFGLKVSLVLSGGLEFEGDTLCNRRADFDFRNFFEG